MHPCASSWRVGKSKCQTYNGLGGVNVKFKSRTAFDTERKTKQDK